jgi:hypothetical protein
MEADNAGTTDQPKSNARSGVAHIWDVAPAIGTGIGSKVTAKQRANAINKNGLCGDDSSTLLSTRRNFRALIAMNGAAKTLVRSAIRLGNIPSAICIDRLPY